MPAMVRYNLGLPPALAQRVQQYLRSASVHGDVQDALRAAIEVVYAPELLAYCQKTRRQPADVCRAALEILLADGFEAAERKLAAGVWGDSPSQTAERIIAGSHPGGKRKGKSA